jgi:FkbM family methyltransferase
MITKDRYFPYIQKYNIHGISFDFWTVDETARDWYLPEDREKIAEISGLIQLVDKGDRILEIGSHHGFHTMLLSCLAGDSGFVLGLEASPFNAQVAHSQIALNDFGNFCKVKNWAAAEKTGTLNLTKDSNATVTSADNINSIPVKSVTGDNLLDIYGNFDLLKLDVEGFEAHVLAGCKKILKNKPKLAIELHVPQLDHFGSDINEIFELINICDYDGVMIQRSFKYDSQPLSVNNIPNDIVNLLLKPKKNTGYQQALVPPYTNANNSSIVSNISPMRSNLFSEKIFTKK